MQAVSIKFNQLFEFISVCLPHVHMRLSSIYVALLRSSGFFFFCPRLISAWLKLRNVLVEFI